MVAKAQKHRNQLSRKNPLFEKYVDLSKSQQVNLVQNLFQNTEDEIAHSRTDTIKLHNFLIAQIPNFVLDLEKKNFWKYLPTTQTLAHPDVLFIPQLPITYSAKALNTQMQNTPLKVYITASENLESGVRAFYAGHTHSIYMPVNYEKVFEQGNFSTSVKISRITQAFKMGSWLYELIHEIQHARDHVELQNFQYVNFIAQQSQMAQRFEILYDQKVNDLTQNPTQIDTIFDDARAPIWFGDMLKTDFQIFLDKLDASNQDMLKSSQTSVKNKRTSKPRAWNQLEEAFISTSKYIGNQQLVQNLSALQSILGNRGKGLPISIPPKNQNQTAQNQSTTSNIQKQLQNVDFYSSIQTQILQAIKEYPNSYQLGSIKQKTLEHLETVFKECSNSIRYTAKSDVPLSFIGFFQVEGIDFTQRIISKFLNKLYFEPNMELPIQTYDMSNIDPNWTQILRFDDMLNRFLMCGEIYSYQTQEVDETISDAILGWDLDTARIFHGSTFYGNVFSKFASIRYPSAYAQNQKLNLQFFELSLDIETIIREALSDLFKSVFEIDFSLVKDTFFDFTSQIKDCSYADLVTTQPYVSVNGKQIDVLATKQQIVELFLANFKDFFFSKNKIDVMTQLFLDIMNMVSSTSIFLTTLQETNANLITDSLYEAVMEETTVQNSIDLIQNVSKRTIQVRDELWNRLSFSEKYISNTRTLLLSLQYAFQPIEFCLKHQTRMSSLSALYDQQNKQIPTSLSINKQKIDACLNFLESKSNYMENAIHTYVDATQRFYSVCAKDYIDMHPDKQEAQSYVENLAQLHKKWINKFKNAYTKHISYTKSSQDIHSKEFLQALEPFIDFFYENTVSMVMTSNDFDQYIIQPSEENILSFQKLIESKNTLSLKLFREFHNLVISRLIVGTKVVAQDPIQANTEGRDIFDKMYKSVINLSDLLTENTECLLYVLRDADLVSDHYKLGIILSMLSHNLALCTISQFFIENA